MRKLASIRKISAINPIENADAIEVATIDGWKVVVKRGEFKVGDLAVYLEVDSWVPTELAPFLSKGKEPREFNGIKGERLRTIKLRGQLSQGLLLPLNVLTNCGDDLDEGADVTEALGIQKWERPIPAQLAGLMKGSFPSFIPKTDQERVQNLVTEIRSAAEQNLMFEVTEKLEGSSMTVYLRDDEFGVCSRNIDLKRDETNSFWAMAIKLNMEDKLRTLGKNIAIQGELIGPGIQGNIYKLGVQQFNVFDIYDIDAGEYLLPDDRRELTRQLGLFHVPVIEEYLVIDGTVDGLLTLADGKSDIGSKPLREGLVFKQVDGGMTFKAVSNAYLLAGGE
jgi:RNA ligase (TIGR02306 family)